MARVFDRTNSDKIEYSYLADIAGATKVAVSFWLYPTGSNSYDHILAQAASGFNGIGILHNLNDATSLFAFARNADNNPYHQYASGVVTLNAWNHVLMQYDGAEATAANRLRVYVGGSLLTPAGSGGTLPTTVGTEGTPAFTLGAGGGTFWSGRLAGVWVWEGVVLDSTERTALAGGDLGSTIQGAALLLDDGLWQGTTPTNAVTSTAATVTGTTETTDPPLLDPPPSAGGQPLAKRRGGVIHAGGAMPLGVRRW